MLSIGQLGKKFSLSRATLLYYEKEGILCPASRSGNNYRWYGEAETEQLRQIVAFRSYGIPIKEIRGLLNRKDASDTETALKKRFAQLDGDIARLRTQQRAIMALFDQNQLETDANMSKEKWTAIMSAAGLSEYDMWQWHREFEAREPEGHRAFLVSLNLDNEEIESIRKASANRRASS